MTLRQLVAMARGRDRQLWWHTAALMALVANCHRDPKQHGRPFAPAEFHPYERRAVRGTAVGRETMGAVVAMFVSAERAQAALARAAAEKAAAESLAERQRAKLQQRLAA